MSGSIGGSRIYRSEVQPTTTNYINNVLKQFPGFVSAEITGSYNAGIKKDHGDIDLVVYIKGDDIKTIKKQFKDYLNSLDLPHFKSGKNIGKKSQMYGSIVTCGYPINNRCDEYVQVDNIIVNNEADSIFQKEFLNLDAAKQGLLMGLVRVMFGYKNINNLPLLNKNQDYEFVLSSTGLSFRRVTLNDMMKEINREILWRTNNWEVLKELLNQFDLNKSYEELLNDIDIFTRGDNRSRRRIIGIMKSMINVGVGEIGTLKGEYKQNSIKLIENILG